MRRAAGIALAPFKLVRTRRPRTVCSDILAVARILEHQPAKREGLGTTGKNDRDCRGTLKTAGGTPAHRSPNETSERRSVASLARLSLEIDPANYELLLALLDARRFNNGLPTDRCSVDDTSFIASSTLLAEEDDEVELVANCD